jgi:hypothetical protein
MESFFMATSVAQLFGMSTSISNSCRGGEEAQEKSKNNETIKNVNLYISFIPYKSL